ncbi:hypothetical protein VYU27_007501 [Nannochloropsis oceanica]
MHHLPCRCNRRARQGYVWSQTLGVSSSSTSSPTTTTTTTTDDDGKDTGGGPTSSNSSFSVVAADVASRRPSRRFNVSTRGGEGGRAKVQVFRDLTRNRDPSWERAMEHTTFVSHLPKQLQEYEAQLTNNSLVRDQSRLIINKNDPANRRWLSMPNLDGVGEGGYSTASYLEREALASKARLGEAQGAVYRRKAGWMGEGGREGGTGGVPEEGLSVEEKIQLSMAQGDFDDLKGKGKPLEKFDVHHYATDKTSATYMDVLAKSGVKPVWIERSLRIKEAEKRVLKRLEGEWAKVVLEIWEEEEKGKGKGGRAGGRSQWRERVLGMRCLREDLAWVNAEIDLYNLQVPSMSLQRMRLKLDHLCEAVEERVGGGGGWMDKTTARAVVREGEKEGMFSNVTALGSLRLEAEELKKTKRKDGKGSGGGSDIWGGGGSPSGAKAGAGRGGGMLDTITSWFSMGQTKP